MPAPRLAAPIALLLLLTVSTTDPAQAAPDESSCRLLHDLLPAVFAECSTLVVPQDYDAPDGPGLELFVARIPALTASPAADPLVLINGGPGGSTVDLYLQTRTAFEPVRRDRDILLLDQRGTGRSLSGLDCELPEEFDLVTADQDEIRANVDACISEFEYDPRFFTTSVAVRDLESLREAFAIDSWNIYGISYGTRVAQHYLRQYGERVRTMILDGIVPAELTLGPGIASDAQSALDAIFARCAASPGCAERYAELSSQFAELNRRFDGQTVEVIVSDPVTGNPESIELDQSYLQGVVRLMSYSDATVALLPLIIDAAFQGNYQPLAAQAKMQIESVAESLGFAMHNSVVCTEDAPWFPEQNDPNAAALYLGTTVIDGLRAICESWPRGVIDDAFKTPVVSDRPALLLSGEHDPVTPPEYADRIIESGLTNSRHIVGAAQGHGLAIVGCVPRLIADFVDTADPQAPDTECLEREPPMPFFLSFQGPAP